jgi:aminoglycoside phosphotransferase (APT) family kinase protein
VARVGIAPAATRETLGEERALATLGPGAAAAGATVPRSVASTRLDGVPVVVETGVPGRVAASSLGERPRDVQAVLDRVLAWLLRWNRATATPAALTPSLLEDEVLSPARLVARALPEGDDHVRFLERLCEEAAGAGAALAPAHGDLTMTNVLLAQDGSIGVVDWDTARAAALPLADFFYTVVDARAASQRYVDRARAFSDCFSATGRYAEDVRARQSSFERALGVTPEVRTVSFHACWLHHAANELARGETDGPFVQIARQLADDTGRLGQ